MAETTDTVRPIVTARNLGLRNARIVAYTGVDFTITPGEVTALCGENGTGKSEILLTIAGRMASTSGTLVVDGFNLPKQRAKVRRIAGLGFFDGLNDVQPALSVQTITAAELELCGRKSNRKVTLEYLRTWGFEEFAKQKAENLSAEERVRFGIILGMVDAPRILVIDDIESELTQHQGRKLMQYLKTLTNEGLTVVVGCTEYEIARGADRVVTLSDDARAQQRKVEERIAENSVGFGTSVEKGGDAR